MVKSEPGMLALRADAIDCDVHRFEVSVTTGELEIAVSLYNGPFLDGFHSGSRPFDDWAASERERLSAVAIGTLEKLARRTGGEKGLAYARRLLSIDPSREATYRLNMELLAGDGQRDRAIRMYENCKNILKKELGVEPSRETESLRQSILTSRPAAMGSAQKPLTHRGIVPIRNRPSIGVSSLVNLSGERSDDYFAKGLVQDITTALSQVRDYVVLSDVSHFERNEADADATPFPARSGRRYVLSGSVRRSGHELRVVVQLIDAINGQTVWAQKFDDQAQDELEFQDRIAQTVVLALIVELQLTDWKVRDKSPPGDAEVRRLVNEALIKYYEMTRESLLVSMKLAEEALAIAPENARAKRTLSVAISVGLAFGSLPVEREHVERALRLAEAAVHAVPDDEIARCILSFALEHDGRIDEAIEECLHAAALNPNYPTAYGDLGMLYGLRGQISEALEAANEAIRLGAHDPIDFWRHHAIVIAKFAAQDYHGALDVARKVIQTKPGFVRGALYWAASAAAVGQRDEASRAINHSLSMLPSLNLRNVAPGFVPRYVRDDDHRSFLDMLRKAGLPA